MTSAPIRIEHSDGAVIVTLDRADARNALSRAMMQALVEAVDHASDDPASRSVILTAVGDVFVAGGDLREFAELMDVPRGVDEVIEMGKSLEAIERCDVPVIAAVQGDAFGGGCELILACDLAAMEDQATLSFRQASMGLSTAWGGAVRLIERVGPMRASQLLLMGETVTAAQACSWQLVNERVPRGEALSRALEWTRRMARQPRASVAGCKRALREVREAGRGLRFEQEARVFASLWNGPDHKGAMDAFLKRRG